MKTIVSVALGLVLVLITCSCDRFVDEPMIKGGSPKTLTAKAQTKVFNVIMNEWQPYNGRIDWHIFSLGNFSGENGSWVGSDRVDTLGNGDMVISYDWARFRVPKEKTWVEVTVTENKSDRTRSIIFDTTGEGKWGGPSFLLYQDPKK